MRKVVAYELVSLDGVAEDPDQFVTDFDEVMEENLASVIATQDTVVLGRRTYDEWARFWPRSDIEPFAAFINGVEKLVATSAPLVPAWRNATAIPGAIGPFLEALRTRPGRDVGVHGSITLTRALLECGLVDELHLVIAPALVARGRRLFDGAPPRRFALTRCVVSPAGYVLADYATLDASRGSGRSRD